MNIKQFVVFEVIKNERTYRLLVEPGAGYGEIYDVLFEMLNATIEVAQQTVAAANPANQTAQSEPIDTTCSQ